MPNTPRHDEPEASRPCGWCRNTIRAGETARGVCDRCLALLRGAGVTEGEIFGAREAD